MKSAKLLLVVLLALAGGVLVGCSGPDSAATPSGAPVSDIRMTSPAVTQPTRAATPTPTPQPARAAAEPAPTVEIVVRSGRTVLDTVVYDQPGGAPVDNLPAGALAIVTGSSAAYYRIVFAGAPGGYGWVAQDAVSFAAQQPIERSDSAPVVQESAPVETVQPTTQAAPPAARPAAETRLSGKLVFQTSNGGDIYVMNADGSGLRRLTYGFDPVFSPDGGQVAFTRWDEPRGLWVIHVDGTGERLLLGANRARSPTWAPDGQSIVFEREGGSATCLQSPFGCLSVEELQALFGGQPCLITPFGSFCIADFARVTSTFTALVRFDLASGSVTDLPTSQTAASPRYKPDGSAVLYLDKQGLALVGIDSDQPAQRLVPMPPLLAPAAYSPDGQFIYAGRFAGNRWDLWRWQADGSQPAALTAPDPLAAQPASHVAPAVSPDGQTLVFLTNRSGPWQLWLINRDGSNPRPLAPQALAGITFRYDYSADRVVDWGP